MSIRLPILVAALIAGGLPAPAQAPAERYYLALFGSTSLERTKDAHVWATAVRTQVISGGESVLAWDTISWMPASLKIRPIAVKPEPGLNMSLSDTFAWAESIDARVSVWGPYEIDCGRYRDFLDQKTALDSGTMRYRAWGGFRIHGTISNCGQAVGWPITDPRRYFQPAPQPGEKGTSLLAKRIQRSGVARDAFAHTWLLPVIGADAYPITQRQPGERVPR